jgi:hypothetical protein
MPCVKKLVVNLLTKSLFKKLLYFNEKEVKFYEISEAKHHSN